MQNGDSIPLARSGPFPTVEAAVARLEELDGSDLQGAVEIYEHIHRSLTSALEGDATAQPSPAEW
jgi:hypothetical protein